MDKVGLVGPLLIGVGAVLLIVRASLAYPYVHSRLAGPVSLAERKALIQGPTVTVDTGNPPSATQAPQAGTKAPAEAPEPSPAANPVIVSAFIPTVTPKSSESEPQGADTTPPTRIVIPSLSIDGPIVPVSWCRTEIAGEVQAAWEVPDAYAAGWHETSAPLGMSGNTVLNGHNSTNGEILRDLYKLKVGDVVIPYSQGVSLTYAVSETLILREAGQPLEVRLESARYVKPTDDERLTLVTCHPYGSLRNRLIIIARADKPTAYSEPVEE
jgi:LPXTG-site transpeptidase (sortase) family protein